MDEMMQEIAEAEELRCPCCGQHFFSEKNAFEICPVCGWEDDRVQREDPDFAGGANKMSLNEAKKAFRAKLEAEHESDQQGFYAEPDEDVRTEREGE